MSDTTTTSERWGHAAEEWPRRWEGAFWTREDAINDGRGEYGNDEFWIVKGTLIDPGDLLPAIDDLLDQISYNARDALGEAADELPDVSDDAEAELSALLLAWARKHIRAEVWRTTGEPEHIKAGAS